MYKFTDTIASAGGVSPLPAEALSINGQYIENLLPGYKTLHVSGRELLGSSIESAEMDYADGSHYQHKRYPSRKIVVTYQLAASTPAKFREAFNTLNGILNVEEARLMFADEPDKYFTGTLSDVDDVPPGRNSVTGSFTMYCADPFKRSDAIKTFGMAKNSFGIIEMNLLNEGTQSVPVTYRIKHKQENGYVGIVSEHGAMEFGKIQELDGENYQVSETLLTGGLNTWPDYTGAKYQDTGKGTSGSLSTLSLNGKPYLALSTTGSAGTTWRGGMKQIDVTADSEGHIGAKNWYCWFETWFETGLMGQTGCVNLDFLTADNKIIASYIIEKLDTTGNTARALFYVGGNNPRIWKDFNFTPSNRQDQNPFDSARGWCDIYKYGDTISFYWWGSRHNITVPELANVECAKVGLYIGQYANRSTGDQMVTRCYMRTDNFYFTKNNVEKWRDIPNRYPAGSVLVIDGEEHKPYLNGLPCMDDEVKGTQYFKAPPGTTKVQIYKSDFGEIESVTAEIREAWI